MKSCRGNWFTLSLPALVLAVLLVSCGAAPRVRVTPTPGGPAGAVAAAADAPLPIALGDSGDSPPTHRVVAGETLYSIAFRQGRDYRELAAINRIRAPFTIYPGQLLYLQAATAALPTRPVARSEPAPPAAATATGTATATATFALVDPERPLTAQVLPEARPVVQEVRLSEPGRLLTDPPLVAAAAPVPVAALAAGGGTLVVAPKPLAVAAPPIDDHAASRTVDGLRWRWPAGGKLIGRFLAGDPTQQGIDLAGKVGEPVHAAADGEVVYSGDGLLGYGELLIVQHSPDYLSAYGHNQRRLVQEGEQVRAGQVIAEQGQRGSISLLHFEVRRRGKPVDPLSYLPPR